MECLGCGILCRWWWWNNGMIDKNKNYCSKFRNCPACSCGIWAEHRQKPQISLNSDMIWSQSELIRAGEAAQYENASYNAGCTWGSKEYQICTTLASFADIYYMYCQFLHNDDDDGHLPIGTINDSFVIKKCTGKGGLITQIRKEFQYFISLTSKWMNKTSQNQDKDWCQSLPRPRNVSHGLRLKYIYIIYKILMWNLFCIFMKDGDFTRRALPVKDWLIFFSWEKYLKSLSSQNILPEKYCCQNS